MFGIVLHVYKRKDRKPGTIACVTAYVIQDRKKDIKTWQACVCEKGEKDATRKLGVTVVIWRETGQKERD